MIHDIHVTMIMRSIRQPARDARIRKGHFLGMEIMVVVLEIMAIISRSTQRSPKRLVP